MERRKGIPLVALVIFIALLVAVILTCVIILSANKNKKKPSEPAQVAEEPTPQTTTSAAPSGGDELLRTLEDEKDLNDSTEVQNAFKTVGNKKTYAKYAIYQSGGFDTAKNNLSNELKLALAFSQITNEDMDKDSSTKSIAKTTIEKYAQKIFEESDDINYVDLNLYNNDKNFLDYYKISGYLYDQETDKYKVIEGDVTEEHPPEIAEVVTKANIYTNKIELFVKPIFTETFIYEDDYAISFNYGYNFQDQEYTDNVFATMYGEYENKLVSTYNKDVDGFVYKSVAESQLKDLREYKYTLIKKDNDYKIKSFELITKEEEQPEITELNDDQIQAFNEEIEKYKDNGTNVSASSIKEMLESILSLNENYVENAKNVVGVELTVDGETYEKKVSESDKITPALVEEINGKIKDMIDSLNEDSTYSVSLKYKNKIIKNVTIKEE